MYTDMLNHSAEGSTWTKKTHKYIRKEGKRYIYPEDLNKRERSARDIISDKGIQRTEKNSGGSRTYSFRNRDGRSGVKNVVGAATPYGSSTTNKRYIKPESKGYAKNRTARDIVSDKQAVDREKLDVFVSEQRQRKLRSNSQARTSKQKLLREEQTNRNAAENLKKNENYRVNGSNEVSVKDARDQAYLKRSRENRFKSAVVPYRERSGNPSRIEYTTDANGNTRRKVTSRNDEGVKTTSNSVTKRSRSARDIISDKGIERVSYNNLGKDRYRTTTHNDFTSDREKVDKNAGERDTRSALKKKIDEIKWKKEAKENRKARKKEAKEKAKAQKEQQKEIERQKLEAAKEVDKTLPAHMRRKRQIKRGKKVVQGIIDKLITKPLEKTGSLGEHTTKDTHTEKWVDENGNTHIPANESYVYDKRSKKYVRAK